MSTSSQDAVAAEVSNNCSNRRDLANQDGNQQAPRPRRAVASVLRQDNMAGSAEGHFLNYTSSSGESSEEHRNASDSETSSEPNENEVSCSFTSNLREQGYEDWEIVDRASDPLIGATISRGYDPTPGVNTECVAYVGECVQDKSSGQRLYSWCTVDGFTGISTQQEIYQRHPDMLPLVLTVTCFVDEGGIAVSGSRQSGEAVSTVHLHSKKCFSAHVEMKTKFAKALGHNTHGLVLLTPRGDCLHDVAKFAPEFFAQQEALHKQQDAVAGVGNHLASVEQPLHDELIRRESKYAKKQLNDGWITLGEHVSKGGAPKLSTGRIPPSLRERFPDAINGLH